MKTPWLSLIVGAVVLGTAALAGEAPDILVWDRARLADQPWRLLTGHLVHADGEHLFWNLLAWMVLGTTTERLTGTRQLAAALGAGIVAVNLSLLALPGIAYFCGLSSILNTVYAVACLTLWHRQGGILPALLLAGGAAKILVEMVLGSPLLTSPAWPPVPETHAAGLAAGLLMAVLTGCPRQPVRRPREVNGGRACT